MHCHIPKTAGSALNRTTLLPRFPKGEIALKYGTKFEQLMVLPAGRMAGRVNFLSGHVPFGFAADQGRAVYHVSVLRDPVERMLSFLNFSAMAKRHGVRAKFQQDMPVMAQTDPERFVSLMLTSRVVMLRQSNIMTRLISGLPRLSDLALDDQALSRAIAHADRPDYLIGLQSDFDTFATDIADWMDEHRIGIRDLRPELATSAVLEKRFDRVIRRADLSDRLIDRIRALSDLDIRLCDHVSARIASVGLAA